MELIIALVTATTDTPNDNLVNEARELFTKINKTTANDIIADKQDEINLDVAQLEKRINATSSAEARYYVYKTCDLYNVIYKKPADRLPYLQHMLSIIADGLITITEREKALTRFKIADVFYDENKIENAYELTYEFYKKQPESFKGLLSGFHILIETAILLEKYDEAEGILNKEFTAIIAAKEEPFCSFAHLNYIKLYLHRRNYEKAIHHVIELKNIHGHTHSILLESQIRLFEKIYFFLIGDIDYAQELITMNKSFFEDPAIFQRSPWIRDVLNAIDNCVEASVTKHPLSKQALDTIKNFQIGPKAIFGVLLSRMAERLDITSH